VYVHVSEGENWCLCVRGRVCRNERKSARTGTRERASACVRARARDRAGGEGGPIAREKEREGEVMRDMYATLLARVGVCMRV